MKKNLEIIGALMLAVTSLAAAQTPPPTYYAESIRKSATRITEDKFEVKLTPSDASYKQRLRDSSGAERYELTISPKIPEGQGTSQITSWEVGLRDLRYGVYGNLLQFDRELSENPKDNLYWLNPSQSAPVNIRARRIIKVDGFYIAFQVKDFRFIPEYSPYLVSMTVQLELTNHDPRTRAP